MKKLTTISTMAVLGLALSGCFESGSETTPPPVTNNTPPPTSSPTGVVADGKSYFINNCYNCHSAGVNYPGTHFGASDLSGKQDMIATNMSSYDPTTNLMTGYTNVPAQQVLDLKVFLTNPI